ncbi:Polar-differentiation response regulator DivK [Rubripirellula lacrimiformis]|uniref:Polar-differentiation response regulator DivK n=1 Tax=Rubripirellula lacrimiformis TaxID=1930273 RepID=A0A517NEL0_9BACT|nr:response regulator [Rubripirellula lacrimiformis]QDT05569.1 Polar-differentiation response regulator DivK [Rubripirellula lacrimiformis]
MNAKPDWNTAQSDTQPSELAGPHTSPGDAGTHHNSLNDGPHTAIHSSHQKCSYPVDRPWILCIDDDVDFSNGLKWTLQSSGFEVVRAFEGEQGYRFAFDLDPAVILLDLGLPKIGGEEWLAHLTLHPDTSHIPVIIVTAMNEQGLHDRLLSQGAKAVFQKPVSAIALIRKIKQLSGSDQAQ